MGKKKGGWRDLDASANEALTRFCTRTGYEPVETRMPFAEMIEKEEDGTDEPVGDYEIRQRHIGVKAFFRFLTDRGVHPAMMLKQLVSVGRALHAPPFHEMTMKEAGMLLGETTANHSYRCNKLSELIQKSGQKGARIPGQKTDAAKKVYRKIRQGNTNRRDGQRRQQQTRQSSFLKALHVPPNKHKPS